MNRPVTGARLRICNAAQECQGGPQTPFWHRSGKNMLHSHKNGLEGPVVISLGLSARVITQPRPERDIHNLIEAELQWREVDPLEPYGPGLAGAGRHRFRQGTGGHKLTGAKRLATRVASDLLDQVF